MLVCPQLLAGATKVEEGIGCGPCSTRPSPSLVPGDQVVIFGRYLVEVWDGFADAAGVDRITGAIKAAFTVNLCKHPVTTGVGGAIGDAMLVGVDVEGVDAALDEPLSASARFDFIEGKGGLFGVLLMEQGGRDPNAICGEELCFCGGYYDGHMSFSRMTSSYHMTNCGESRKRDFLVGVDREVARRAACGSGVRGGEEGGLRQRGRRFARLVNVWAEARTLLLE
jgi:hypothetical protein